MSLKQITKKSLIIFALSTLISLMFVASVSAANINSYLDFWNFNNQTVSATQTNRTSFNGTLLAETGGTPTLQTGKILNGTGFNGAAGYLNSATARFGNNVNGSKTVSVWVKANTTSAATNCATGGLGIVYLGNDTSDTGFMLCQRSGGYQIAKFVPGVNYFMVNASVGIDTTTFHQVGYTWNLTTRNMSIYYDGVLKNSTILPNANPSADSLATGIEIGRAGQGGSAIYSGIIDSVLIDNSQVYTTSDMSSLYCNGSGNEAPLSSPCPSSASNVTINAKDFYTTSSLSNFSVSIDGTTLYTTNGTVLLPYLSNSSVILNFTVNSSENGGYFNQSYSGINASVANWVANISQSAISFAAYEKISNNVISGATFTSTYSTNSTQYMRAGSYDVTASKSGYYSAVRSIIVSPYDILSYNISNLSSAYINLTMRYNLTNTTITTYNATFESLNYSYSEIVSTTNGSIYLPLIAGDWQITIDGPSTATYSFNVTLVNGMNNVTRYTFASDSYFFRVYDELTNALLNTTSVNIQVIGSLESFNVTTTNGTWYQDLVQPDSYTIRYSASGYTERFSYFTLTANSHTSVDLYLLSSSASTNVTITLYNQDRALVKNALIKILKYSIDDNTYSIKNMAFTDNDGVAYFDAVYNAEFYKFIVEYPAGTVVLVTEPSYIRSTQITLQYVSGISGTSFFDTVFGIQESFVFNSASNSFRLDYTSPSNTVSAACVYVYETSNNDILYDTSCLNATTGTILVPVANTTGTVYTADVFYTVLAVPQYAGSQVADFTDRSDWENTGMLFVLFLTMGMVLIFRENPKLSILTISLPLIFANIIGFVSIEWWIPIGIAAMSVIIVWIISRWS